MEENRLDMEYSLPAEELLLNYFPECKRDALLEYLNYCAGDINVTINHLLDGGYPMTGDDRTRRLSAGDAIEVQGDGNTMKTAPGTPSSSKERPLKSQENVEPMNEYHGLGDAPLTHSSSSPSSSLSSGSEKVECSYFENQEIASDESTWDSDFRTDSPVEGEGWIEMELPPEFAQRLTELYGDLCVNFLGLRKEDFKIKVPPNIAFELYRFLVLNAGKCQKQAEESNWVTVSKGGKYPSKGVALKDLKLDGELGLPFGIDQEIKQNEIEMLIDEMCDLQNRTSYGLSFAEIQERDRKLAEQTSRIRELYALKRTMAQTVKMAQLQHSFPLLQRTKIEDVFVQCELNFEKALELLQEMYPSKYAEQARKEPVPAVCQSVFPHGNTLLCYDPEELYRMTAAKKREFSFMAQFWSREFEDLQKCLTEYKHKINGYRNRLPETLQYFREEANGWHEKLKMAQEQYQFYTVYSQNCGSDPNKIDLHGLTVKYALQIVSAYLENRSVWARNNLPEYKALKVRVITGMGKHSVNNIPRLNPAVRAFLLKGHYSFTDGGKDNLGCFTIHIGRTGNQNARQRRKK